MNTRSETLDIAKGIAIIFIVITHIIFDKYFDLQIIGILGLSSFVFISGIFYKRKSESVLTDIWIRNKVLLLKYTKYSIMVSVLVGTFYLLTSGISLPKLLENFLLLFLRETANFITPNWFRWNEGVLYPFTGGASWYILTFVFTNILFFPFARYSQKEEKSFYLACVSLFLLSNIVMIFCPLLPYQMNIAPCFALIMLLGMKFKNYVLALDEKTTTYKLVLITIGCILYGICFAINSPPLLFMGMLGENKYIGTTTFTFLTIGATMVLIPTSSILYKWKFAAVDFLVLFGRNTLVVLFFHGFVSLVFAHVLDYPTRWVNWAMVVDLTTYIKSVSNAVLTILFLFVFLKLRKK